MALSGLNATCGFVGVKGGGSLLASFAWSQTMSSPGTTTLSAREPSRPSGQYDALLLGFEVTTSIDAWVSVGPAPDASQANGSTPNTARILVRSGETRNVFCNSGDYLAWTAA